MDDSDPRVLALGAVVEEVTGWRVDHAYAYAHAHAHAHAHALARDYAHAYALAHAHAYVYANANGYAMLTDEQKTRVDAAHALLFT